MSTLPVVEGRTEDEMFEYNVNELIMNGNKGLVKSLRRGPFQRGYFESAVAEIHDILDQRFPHGWTKISVIAYPGGREKKNGSCQSIEHWLDDWETVETLISEDINRRLILEE